MVADVPASTLADPAGRHDDEDGAQGQVFVPALLRREGRVEEPVPVERSGRTHRGVATAVGLMLACAIVTASTAALAGPQTDRSVPGPGGDRISATAALRPDLITQAMDRGLPGVLQPRGAPAGEPAPGPPPVAGGLGEALDPVQDPVLDPVLGTVTSFFQTAATAPDDAFGLLDAPMQGTGLDGFRESWAGVEGVRIDTITREGPHSAVVAMTLVRADGGELRTLQRVVVTAGAQPRIRSATLLSAASS